MAGVSRTATAPGPKRSMPSPKRRSVPACSASRSASSSGRSTMVGHKQHLRRHRPRIQRILQRLVDKPLMRGMLVDDDQRVAGLRHDVVFVHLRARRAEVGRPRCVRELRCEVRASALQAAGVESGLRGFAEAAFQRPLQRSGGLEAADRGAAKAGIEAAMPAGRARMTVDGRTRAESADHRGRARRCGANAGAGQRLADRADDQPAHQPGIAEAHIGLGRVDVDVDQCRIERRKTAR